MDIERLTWSTVTDEMVVSSTRSTMSSGWSGVKKSGKVPGQTRYWTPGEHRRFLEAIKRFGHKDLRAISAYVGTRNVTQVRTHTQKFFMRLLREAKRHRDEVEQATTILAQVSNGGNGPTVTETVIRSVPEECGVALLSLVAQETMG